MNFVSKLDPYLRNYLETSTDFKGVSKTIPNEILNCVFQIYQNEVNKDIDEASLVPAMCDDTPDVSEYHQMVTVFQYWYLLNEKIFECFWGFLIAENKTVDGLSKCILEQLDIILPGNKQKLIAQTFDSASVMKGKQECN